MADDRSTVPTPAELRTELRSWLATFDDARWRAYPPTLEAAMVESAALIAALYAAGFSGIGWPEAAGGRGGDERHRAVLYDELADHGLALPQQYLTLETLGPPLTHFAADLAAEVMPAYLQGLEWWGQCFSEPEAGSDLASLRTRAVPVEGGYAVSGQKVWTSYGATAHRFVALVRTGTPEERHRGLTMVMVDADAPGVTVRPIALASGRNELAEVFFDGAFLPTSRRIGEEGQGWAVAMYLLQWERSMFAWQSCCQSLHRLARLRDEVAAQTDPSPDAPVRLASSYLDLVESRARAVETITRLATGETVGPEASVDKVLLARGEQGVFDAARDLRPSAFALGHDSDEVRDEWWYSRAATIFGGSAEVQRGILADRVLKLPKE